MSAFCGEEWSNGTKPVPRRKTDRRGGPPEAEACLHYLLGQLQSGDECLPMSAVGQKRTCANLIRLTGPHARLACWDVEAESLGSLEVDYKFVLSRCLYRQI